MKEKKKHDNNFIKIGGYLIIVVLTIMTLSIILNEINFCEVKEQSINVPPISNDCLLVTNYLEYIQEDTCEYRPVIVEVIR